MGIKEIIAETTEVESVLGRTEKHLKDSIAFVKVARSLDDYDAPGMEELNQTIAYAEGLMREALNAVQQLTGMAEQFREGLEDMYELSDATESD